MLALPGSAAWSATGAKETVACLMFSEVIKGRVEPEDTSLPGPAAGRHQRPPKRTNWAPYPITHQQHSPLRMAAWRQAGNPHLPNTSPATADADRASSSPP